MAGCNGELTRQLEAWRLILNRDHADLLADVYDVTPSGPQACVDFINASTCDADLPFVGTPCEAALVPHHAAQLHGPCRVGPRNAAYLVGLPSIGSANPLELSDVTCAAGLVCDETCGYCIEPREVGAACSSGFECAAGDCVYAAYPACRPISERANLGAACSLSFNATHCREGLRCSLNTASSSGGTDAVCTQPAAPGEPCSITAPPRVPCQRDAFCAGAPGVCELLKPDGAPCSRQNGDVSCINACTFPTGDALQGTCAAPQTVGPDAPCFRWNDSYYCSPDGYPNMEFPPGMPLADHVSCTCRTPMAQPDVHTALLGRWTGTATVAWAPDGPFPVEFVFRADGTYSARCTAQSPPPGSSSAGSGGMASSSGTNSATAPNPPPPACPDVALGAGTDADSPLKTWEVVHVNPHRVRINEVWDVGSTQQASLHVQFSADQTHLQAQIHQTWEADGSRFDRTGEPVVAPDVVYSLSR